MSVLGWLARRIGGPSFVAQVECTCPMIDGRPMLDGCALALMDFEGRYPIGCCHNGGCPVRETVKAEPPENCCRRGAPV